MRCSHRARAGEFVGSRPVRSAHGDEEPFLLEILLEHVEALGDQRDGGIAVLAAFEHLEQHRRVAEGHHAEGERDRGAQRILRRHADVEQDRHRFFVAVARRSRPTPRPRRAAAPGSRDDPRRSRASSGGSPCATSSSAPSGRCPPRPTSGAPGRPTAGAPRATPGRPCPQSCPGPARRRPAVGPRAWRSPRGEASPPRRGSLPALRSRNCGSSPRHGRRRRSARPAPAGLLAASAASARTSEGRTNSPVSLARDASSRGASDGEG